MQFEVYVKDKETYKKVTFENPANSGWEYFAPVKLLVVEQLDNIREDILKYFNGKTKDEVNLISPKVEDKEDQKRVDILVDMRKANSKTKEMLISLLAGNEFIACDMCKGNMYKIPLNVSYNKTGNTYILTDIGVHQSIEYIYGCEKCVNAIHENTYNEKLRNIKLREQLLADGESFVPNVFGFWHWVNDKKHTKPSCIGDDEDKEPRRRDFEYLKIDGTKSAFVKITEFYPHSGKRVSIK